MPLIITGGRIPPLWAEKKGSHRIEPVGNNGAQPETIQLAFINNMPDPALQDTELQFFELLNAAAADLPVCLKLYFLPEYPRGERGQQHLASFYSPMDELWNHRFDCLVMTGTEPRQPSLRDEPYWHNLVDVLDWAERNTTSAILSCLAAHASVLHSDGIERRLLPEKQFGVFEYKRTREHALTGGAPQAVRFPHSRWNEVREDELTSCGYAILTQSAVAGVDSFIKKRGKSLFIHFQGHPEYGERTLMREYRRDIKRFLKRERESYPLMPEGYFDVAATTVLNDFKEQALSDRSERLLADFPEAALAGTLQNTWRATAVAIYRNWLQYVASRKAEVQAPIVRSARAFQAHV